MAMYEVRVEGIQIEFYTVKADSEAEAMRNWASGEYVGGDSIDFAAVGAVLEFDQEDDDAEEDEYEDDPLHHGTYDD